jgi:hypothetical protein
MLPPTVRCGCARLREHPEAFTSSLEEEEQFGRPRAWSETRLRDGPAARPHDFFLGGFVQGDALVGTVGLQGRYRAKERHNASVVGMFVAPEAGGVGLGAGR